MAFSKFGLFLNIPEYFTVEILENAKQAAIDEMNAIPKNAGQDAIFEQYVAPAFEAIPNNYEEVDLGAVYSSIPEEYITFMGEIVEIGLQIVQLAVNIIQYTLDSDYTAGLIDAFGEAGSLEELDLDI